LLLRLRGDSAAFLFYFLLHPFLFFDFCNYVGDKPVVNTSVSSANSLIKADMDMQAAGAAYNAKH